MNVDPYAARRQLEQALVDRIAEVLGVATFSSVTLETNLGGFMDNELVDLQTILDLVLEVKKQGKRR